ncbi:MAG TPA: intein-containing Rv2578c family radical SAM protein [Pseudonocardiaceae bacterium]
MRWNNLALSDQDALFGVGDVVARTIDTPEFRDMTFYEVQARSIINKVPGASRMPFGWTVNPYRGCSHACRYCLPGDTPILMADGRTTPLADVRVGAAIYGTAAGDGHRRYTVTEVLAHWRTVKQAYRVTLRDGTELVASGDHRFLTAQGWKHAAARPGSAGRPCLMAGDELIGTGQFASPPDDTPDYRRGYLGGIVRGGSHLGLGVVDRQALRRVSCYFVDAVAHARELVPRPAGGPTLTMSAARSTAYAGFQAITDMTRWPCFPGDGWCKGFLAGIFDAAGHCRDGVLRIASTDADVIRAVISGSARFGFSWTVADGHPDDLRCVQLLGGIGEQLRFVHTVDPAITWKRSIEDVAIPSGARLSVVSVEDLGTQLPMYDITTGTGDFIANGMVSHNCFARRTHEYLELDSGQDFDSKIVVKVNAPELLRRELSSPRWTGEHIAMGTNVDPYQRVEGRYRLMRGVIEALRDARNPFSILTKGTLVLRDLDLIQQAAEVTDVSVNISVGFVDETLWRQVEPGTPRPTARLDVCRTLTDAGIGCGVLMAPILPYLTDSPSRLEATVCAIAAAGARGVSPIVLHLRPGAREWYLAWLQREYPELVPRYRELYAGGAYAPKHYQRAVSARVAELARRHGVGTARPSETRRQGTAATGETVARVGTPSEEAQQLTLL